MYWKIILPTDEILNPRKHLNFQVRGEVAYGFMLECVWNGCGLATLDRLRGLLIIKLVEKQGLEAKLMKLCVWVVNRVYVCFKVEGVVYLDI